MAPPPLVECVPNVSEGRDPARLARFVEAIQGVAGVRFLHLDPGADANRAVLTFTSEDPVAVAEAAFRLARLAMESIDLRTHRGKHPRIGALDVCPFVPLRGMDMATCVALARSVGRRIGEELEVPVFLYGEAATVPARRDLARVRRGQFEALSARLERPEWAPDFGPAKPHPTAGAFAVGARGVLVAHNITLESQDETLAKDIAARIRSSGRMVTGTRDKGLLPAVKAIGWTIEEFGRVQVSMNLVDPEVTPPHVAYEAVDALCREAGVSIYGSEIVGLVPLAALLRAGQERWTLDHGDVLPPAEPEMMVALGMQYLKLNQPLHPFDPEERILEWQL